MIKKILFSSLAIISFLFFIPSNLYSQQAPPFSVTEEDGAPEVWSPYKLKFTSGSVTDNLDGTVSIAVGGGAAIILDLGDDGVNESTNLSEIATINDTGSIWSEPSADKLLFDGTNLLYESELDVESELEGQLGDVTNVFTNNDGALTDDDVTDDNVESMTTAGGSGTVPLSDGVGNLSMTDVLTEAEIDTESELEAQITDVTDFWNSNDINSISNTGIEFEGATADTYETTLSVTDPTADRTVTIPDIGGEVSLLGQTIGTAEVESGITLDTEWDTSSEIATAVTDETGSGSLVFGTSPTFTTDITTPKVKNSGDITIDAINAAANSTVTVTNSDTTYSTTLNADALQEGSVDVPNVNDNLGVFASTTSSQLAGVISDETGTGALVFGTSPTFTTDITTPKVKNSGDITVDAVNATANSTVTVTNSDATYSTVLNADALQEGGVAVYNDNEMDTEAELEGILTDVTNLFTNNDGALTDDDLTDNTTDDLAEGTTNLYYTDARAISAVEANANIFTANQTLDKTGTATSITQYPSYDINLTGSAWDTTNAVAEDKTITLRNIAGSGADGAEPYRLGILDNAGSEFVTFEGDTQRVGFGTTEPNFRLTVQSSGTATSPFVVMASGGGIVGFFNEDASGNGNIYVRDAANTNTIKIAGGGASYFNAGNVGIGMTVPNYKLDVDGAISCRDMAAPAATAGQSLIYSNAGELYALDDAGNSTLLSPHNDKGEWVFYAKNKKTGKVLKVEMEKLVKFIDKKFGTNFVHEKQIK